MIKKQTKPKINLLIEILDQSFDKPAWHGSNLRGSIKGLKLKELLWRQSPKRHNIWEIVIHCAYWKYVVRRRITGGKKGEFPRKPSNFSKLPTKPQLSDWKKDLRLLSEEHTKLRQAIIDFPEAKLYKCPPKSKVSYIQTIYGVSSHDIYHAGQIQLLKRMQRK